MDNTRSGASEKSHKMNDFVHSPTHFPTIDWHLETPWEDSNFQIGILVPYDRLPHIVETTTRLNKIREEMKTLSEEEKRIMIELEEDSKQEIEDLKSRLVEETNKKTVLQQKVTELLDENARLQVLVSHQSTEGAPTETCELQENDMTVQKLESEKKWLREEIQDPFPLATRAEELENKLPLWEEIISSSCSTVAGTLPSGNVSSYPNEEVENVDRDEEEVMPGKCKESSPNLHRSKSIVNETAPADLDLKNEFTNPDNDNGPSTGISNEVEAEEQDLRIRVGSRYILASDSRFFTIDWSKQYQHTGPHLYSCKLCDFNAPERVAVIDHTWVKHYGGRFNCPHCPKKSLQLTVRYHLKKHIKQSHPDIV
ncbi:uncharacterized protein LOC107037252 [Diachasma alloeum]|uniref:uncharacterized protein LOC107037252 n=1 Tax=Diachasma alloeum TaxID=454923 RepID=UPI0007383FEC|nr:uncharacterized protein LOC107037252 [Diachasma alloeum]